jgi:signal transduction histidine kinase
MATVGAATLAGVFGDVCDAHTHVLPTESYAALAGESDRLRSIAALQQQAHSLQAEIAERQRVEQRLQEALAAEQAARAAAEAALRTRDEFLAVAAHELRTPLAALMGHAQLALRRLRRDERQDQSWTAVALETVSEQAKKLSRLVTQLLDISRLESGKLPLERRPTDLAALVEQIVAGARMWTERHAITLVAPPALDVLVDPDRLEQVVANLLQNAIRYSPNGEPIEVSLAVLDTGAPRRPPQPGDGAAGRDPAGVGGGAAGVELAVRDHGLGIPREKRGQLFERFYQAHRAGYRSGLGLGLYVSQQIVAQHGGAIWAEFPPDGGTRFVVRLPLAGTAPAALGPAA